MAVPTARVLAGDVLYVPYTPGADVTAGDVVVQGELIGIAPTNIAANELGTLAIPGSGARCLFPISVGSGTGMTAGSIVYWEDTVNVATATAGSNKILGKVSKAAGATDTQVEVIGVNQKT